MDLDSVSVAPRMMTNWLNTPAVWCISGSSNVAAIPIACGNMVAAPCARNTVQPLVPPVVFRNPQARDRISGVSQLSDFFLQSHVRDKIVDTLLGQLRVFLRRLIRNCCTCTVKPEAPRTAQIIKAVFISAYLTKRADLKRKERFRYPPSLCFFCALPFPIADKICSSGNKNGTQGVLASIISLTYTI